MRKILGISGIVSIFFVLSACTKANDDVQFPDYTKFPKMASEKIPATINGQQIDLEETLYQNTDMIKLERDTVYLYSKQNSPWLAMYIQETGEKQPDGGIITKDLNFALFENKDGKWNFVKDLLSESTNGILDFLKKKYGLEFKIAG